MDNGGCGAGFSGVERWQKRDKRPVFRENQGAWGKKKAADKRLISLKQKWGSYCYFVCECCFWLGKSVVSLVKIRSSSLASIPPSLCPLVN